MFKENVVAFFVFVITAACFYIWGYYYVPNQHLILFILASIFGVFMAFNIGGNDVANAFGTSVGAKTVTIKQALIIAAVFELSGAVFAGGEVTKTIREQVVNVNGTDYIQVHPLFFYESIWCLLLLVFL